MALCQKISSISQKIERSDTSPNHACHACVHKIRDTFQLYNFIYSTLQKVKHLQTTIPLLWSSAKIFVKFGHQWCSLTMKLTTILVLVDNNSWLNWVQPGETWLHSLLGKQPLHLSQKVNCLQFFLTHVS